MPKRSRAEDSEERFLRKIKKYEKKLLKTREKRGSLRVIYSSDEENAEPREHFQSLESPVRATNESLNEQLNTINEPESLDMILEPNEYTQQEDDLEIRPSVASVVNQVPNIADTDVSVVEDVYDPEVLDALGDFETEETVWGEDIHGDISKRLQFILQNGLKKESKDELLKKYLYPNNTQFAKAPTLNPEVTAMLTDTYRNRDKLMLTKQNQLGKAITALGGAMTSLLKKNPNIKAVMGTLNDCVQLIADSHYTESHTRRALLLPLVDKSLLEPLKETKRDQFLFGDKLSDLVKSSKGIKKTGNIMQASNNLNWRGPATRGRYKQTPNKTAGQRTPYFQTSNSNRRRFQQAPPAQPRRAPAHAPPPPPPPYPPARRQPPHPTAPRRQYNRPPPLV